MANGNGGGGLAIDENVYLIGGIALVGLAAILLMRKSGGGGSSGGLSITAAAATALAGHCDPAFNPAVPNPVCGGVHWTITNTGATPIGLPIFVTATLSGGGITFVPSIFYSVLSPTEVFLDAPGAIPAGGSYSGVFLFNGAQPGHGNMHLEAQGTLSPGPPPVGTGIASTDAPITIT